MRVLLVALSAALSGCYLETGVGTTLGVGNDVEATWRPHFVIHVGLKVEFSRKARFAIGGGHVAHDFESMSVDRYDVDYPAPIVGSVDGTLSKEDPVLIRGWLRTILPGETARCTTTDCTQQPDSSAYWLALGAGVGFEVPGGLASILIGPELVFVDTQPANAFLVGPLFLATYDVDFATFQAAFRKLKGDR